MYEVNCQNCGRIGFHPSRTGAELKAKNHGEDSGHEVEVDPME